MGTGLRWGSWQGYPGQQVQKVWNVGGRSSEEGPLEFGGLFEAGMFPLKLNCWFWGERGTGCPKCSCSHWPRGSTSALRHGQNTSSIPDLRELLCLHPQRSACVYAQGWAGGAQPHPGPTGHPGVPQLQSCVPGPTVGSLGWGCLALSHSSSSCLLTATLSVGEALGEIWGRGSFPDCMQRPGRIQPGQTHACPPERSDSFWKGVGGPWVAGGHVDANLSPSPE